MSEAMQELESAFARMNVLDGDTLEIHVPHETTFDGECLLTHRFAYLLHERGISGATISIVANARKLGIEVAAQ